MDGSSGGGQQWACQSLEATDSNHPFTAGPSTDHGEIGESSGVRPQADSTIATSTFSTLTSSSLCRDPCCPLANSAGESLPLQRCGILSWGSRFLQASPKPQSPSLFTITCGFKCEICTSDLSTTSLNRANPPSCHQLQAVSANFQ